MLTCLMARAVVNRWAGLRSGIGDITTDLDDSVDALEDDVLTGESHEVKN